MRILHIGKYYSPFEGGIENFLSALLKQSSASHISHIVLAHHHQLWKKTAVEQFDEATLLRSFTLCRLLFAPIAPFYYRHLKHTLKTFDPDILHVHMPNLSAFWLLLLGKKLKIPIVVHWHADVVSSRKNRLLSAAYFFYAKLENKLLARSNAIIVTSEPYLDISKPLAKWRQKCHVVPLGLDCEKKSSIPSTTSTPAWKKAGSFKVLCIGRLTYYKGHEYLIRALSSTTDTELIIVGTGKLFGKYQTLVQKLNLQEKITFFGHASAPQLNQLLASCDCLCLPSIERTEAFGLVLLEAMFYNKPCITTSVLGSGMSWVVQHGVTGLIVQPENPGKLGEAIMQLQKNPEFAKKMGNEGKNRLIAQFSLSTVSNKITAVYNSLLSL